MPTVELDVRYGDRRAARVENGALRVTVLHEGGHIAEIYDKQSGINPLWTPRWPSIEPSAYSRAAHPEFGAGADAKLLAGIMGHNVCLDIFGGPSGEEAAAGLWAHGDAAVGPYEIQTAHGALILQAQFPCSLLRFERRIQLDDRTLRIRERVENLAAFDRPIGWTQHVTLGEPFLQRGATAFRVSAGRSRVFEDRFGAHDYLQPGADFTWPLAPEAAGGSIDLRTFTERPASSAYTAHLMDGTREHAFFVAHSPAHRLAFGYVWARADFPWLGIWEENTSRTHSPWNGREMARGMEFGVSPFPETRRRMVERGRLFETPTFRWLPARAVLAVDYAAMALPADRIPESLEWPS